MLIESHGAEYFYDGQTYHIGDEIFVKQGDYEGLYGTITSIRDSDDKETENFYPDFYCELKPPSHPADIRAFQNKMSDLYGVRKTLDDIALDSVILAPTDIECFDCRRPIQKIYTIVQNYYIDGESEEVRVPNTNLLFARIMFNKTLEAVKKGENGDRGLDTWKDDENYEELVTDDSFECWADTHTSSNYYSLRIVEEYAQLFDAEYSELGEKYIDERCIGVLYEQIHCWEELKGMTDEEIVEFVTRPSVVKAIREALTDDEESVCFHSEIIASKAFGLVDEEISRRKKANK